MPEENEPLTLPDQEGAAEALETLLAQGTDKAKEAPPGEKDEQGEESKAPETPEPATEPDGKQDESPAPEDTPAEPEATGIDWIADEAVRADIEGKDLSPETVKYLEGLVRKAEEQEKEYNRGFHARMRKLSEKEKAAEAALEKAESFDKLLEDDTHRKAYARLLQEVQEETSEPFDYINATNEETEAHNLELAQKVRDKEIAADDAYQERVDGAGTAAATYFTELGDTITADQFNAACESLKDQLVASKITPAEFLTEENIVSWLQPHVELALKAAPTPPPKDPQVDLQAQEAARILKASSPKHSGSSAAPTPPRHIQEGRPATEEERVKLTMQQLRDQGIDLSKLED